jgi:steroid delta-isomerase-like uncharacterized protein
LLLRAIEKIKNGQMTGVETAVRVARTHRLRGLDGPETEHLAPAAEDAIEWIWRGRQTKDLPGLPATNKTFEVRGATVVDFTDGKISPNSDYWDLATYMKQVGLTK